MIYLEMRFHLDSLTKIMGQRAGNTKKIEKTMSENKIGWFFEKPGENTIKKSHDRAAKFNTLKPTASRNEFLKSCLLVAIINSYTFIDTKPGMNKAMNKISLSGSQIFIV